MHHAGVAAKVVFMLKKFLALLNIISSFVSLAECNLIDFGSDELLRLRCSISKVMHHAGVAVKTSFKRKKIKQKDSVMQKNKVGEKRVQKSNFFLVVGVLQLSLSYTQFDFSSSRISP